MSKTIKAESLNREGVSLGPSTTFYVDEAGDGVLFGPKGRDRLQDPDASRFFMLGMVQTDDGDSIAAHLERLRKELVGHPLYASIPSMQASQKKTALAFHAKDDHPEIRSKVFELLLSLDFKFFAVIKDMYAVRHYVTNRNRMHSGYRYQPNELYDLTVRMLFRQQLHKFDRYDIVFARRGQSDRTRKLCDELEKTRQCFLDQYNRQHEPLICVHPAFPWEVPCLQVADYCLWALQRCYEKHEDRFLRAIWSKVSWLHDVDDNTDKPYGRYFSRKAAPPDLQKIKSRWI